MAASTEVNSSTTTTTIVQLGDDLLVEILIRLPNPRFTCRCKAVCKRWNSLISDPIRFNRRFVSHHQSRNRQPPLLLHSDDPRAIIRSFIPMTTSRTHSSFSVMDSYKDLVLCGFSNVGPASGYSEPVAELYRSYLLCNPFTKQWVALPLAPELPTGCWHFFTRLVCEPRISNDLDLGEEVFAYSSEFRFRVVCVYVHAGCTKINMFCSDSGEWTKDILVLREHCQFVDRNVVSCNGEVFWCYGVPNQDPGAVQHPMEPFIAAFNPFRPDIPPTAIEPPLVFGKPGWDIGISQGALHAIVFEDRVQPGRSQIRLTLWRLEEDRKSWRKSCVGLMKGPRLRELRTNVRPCLHPEKPQVFFLQHSDGYGGISALSCDLGSGGQLELFAEGRGFIRYWYLFRAEFLCWPTSIPRHNQLRAMYDGSYSCWLQSNKEPATLPPTTDFIVASGKVDEVPGATPVLKSEIMAEVEAILEPLLQLPHGPPLIQRALFFYHRQLLQKLLFVDSVTMANDVQLAALFPGVDPKGAINSECNEVVQFLTHSHREDVTYRAMTVYRVFLMQGLGGFKTEVRVSDKQLSGSAAQTIQGTLAQPTTLHNNLLNDCISRILDASKMREFKTEVRASDKQLSGSVAQTTQGAAAELIVPQNALLDAAAAGVGDPTVAQNVPLDAAVAGG